MSTLIAIGSQHGNGKDSVCNYLHPILNNREEWHKGSFATKVKQIYCDSFGVNMEFIEKWKRIDTPPPGFDLSVREGLTIIGDGFRNICKTVWIDHLLKNNKKNLIISDLRYTNEAVYIQENNGLTILLWRPGYENNVQNKSEQELMQYVNMLKDTPDGIIKRSNIPFNIWLKNDGTLIDLYRKIDNIVVPFVVDFMK